LDIVIRNGKFIIIEIKSTVSKQDMHAFYRRAKYYLEKHNKEADRLIISPNG